MGNEKESTIMSVNYERITLADGMEKLLQYDRDREKKVRFDPKPENFLELDQAQLNRLSSETQIAYSIAREENRELSDEQKVREADVLTTIKAGYESQNATKRLEIRGGREGYVYEWVTPDMVDDAVDSRGFIIVQNGPERTMSNPSGRGPHIISRNGSAELTLIMRTVELHKAARRAKRAAGIRRRELAGKQGAAQIENAGFRSVDDGTRGDFAPIRSTE